MNPSPRPRRGFTLIIAIALVGLVGTTLVLITRQLAYEGRRTRSLADDAQLRQLLLAAADDAAAHARDWKDDAAPNAWQLTLPPSLVNDGAVVTLSPTPVAAGSVELVALAKFKNRQSAQTLAFRRVDGSWKLFTTKMGD